MQRKLFLSKSMIYIVNINKIIRLRDIGIITGQVKWLFLGNNYLNLQKLQQNFPEKERINISKEIRTYTESLRSGYLKWVKKIILRRKNDYIFTYPTVSKYTISEQANVFQMWILLNLAEQIIRKYHNDKTDIAIICESSKLQKILVNRLSKSNISCESWVDDEKYLFQQYTALMKVFRLFTCSIRSYLYNRYRTPKFNPKPETSSLPLTLIHTFYGPNSLLKDGTLKETYYPGLDKILSAAGRQYIFWASLYDLTNCQAINCVSHNSKGTIVFANSLLTLKDHINALVESIKALLYNYEYENEDERALSEMAKESTTLYALSMGVYFNILLVNQGVNLAKQLSPEILIFEYEGQPWEKLLISKIRLKDPKIKIYGYQHAQLATNILSYYSDLEEITATPIPDRILVNGNAWKEWFISQGYPESKIRSASSLRYNDLMERFTEDESITQSNRNYTMVALPIEFSKALELVDKVISGLGETLFNVILKPHPMCRHEEVFEALGRKPPSNFIISYDPIHSLLRKSFVMISIGTSAEIDSLSLSTPVIHVGQECGTQYNSIAMLKIDLTYADSPRELFTHVKDIYEGKLNKETCARSQYVKENCFFTKSEKYNYSFL